MNPNKKKNILIFSKFFFPQITPRAFRATELAKEFARSGHNVTALIMQTDYDYSSFTEQYEIKIVTFTSIANRIPQKFGFLAKIINGITLRLFLLPDLALIPRSYKKLKELGKFDLLISVAYPYAIHWAAALYMLRNGKIASVWVADCGDPFYNNPEKSNFIPFYFKFVENWFVKFPDYISIPVKNSIEAYPKKCLSKIRVIPQGFDFTTIPAIKTVKNENPVFIYAGSFFKNRNPAFFLEHLSTLVNQDFTFIIYTRNTEFLDAYNEILVGKMKVKDYIPRDKLLEAIAKADFVIDFKNKKNLQIPSKLIDYALLNKPILSISQRNFSPQTFEQFLTGDYTHSIKIENVEHYNIKYVTDQFLSLRKNTI